MQTARKKNRSTMDNLIIMSIVIEKQRRDHKNFKDETIKIFIYCMNIQ